MIQIKTLVFTAMGDKNIYSFDLQLVFFQQHYTR